MIDCVIHPLLEVESKTFFSEPIKPSVLNSIAKGSDYKVVRNPLKVESKFPPFILIN